MKVRLESLPPDPMALPCISKDVPRHIARTLRIRASRPMSRARKVSPCRSETENRVCIPLSSGGSALNRPFFARKHPLGLPKIHLRLFKCTGRLSGPSFPGSYVFILESGVDEFVGEHNVLIEAWYRVRYNRGRWCQNESSSRARERKTNREVGSIWPIYCPIGWENFIYYLWELTLKHFKMPLVFVTF